MRIDVADLRRHLEDVRLRNALGAYSATAFTTVGQLAGCVAFHPVEQRLARWLLMVRDRVGTEDLALTHEFLGVMLGVYRPTVTIAIHMLEQAGLIEHRRGHITILNGPRLEEAACECYAAIRAAEKLLE